MPELTLAFAGIICFEGPSEEEGSEQEPKRYASIIRGDGHKAQIFVQGAIEHQSLELPELKSRIAIAITMAGATTSEHFKNYVPHLDRLTTPGTKLDRQNFGVFRIPLPTATLHVLGYYAVKAHYDLRGTIQPSTCVACVTGLTFNVPMNHQFTIANVTIEITSDVWILIENLCGSCDSLDENTSDAAQRSHFKMHRGVTNAKFDSDIADVVPEKNTPCGRMGTHPAVRHLESCHDRTALHPECSNSQWP